MCVVEQLWNCVYECGNKKYKSWEELHQILEKYNKKCEWLPEAIERSKNKELFFIDHIKIPSEKESSLLSLLEIGYLAGSYKDPTKYYKQNNLSAYTQYITPKSISLMNLELSLEHVAIIEIKKSNKTKYDKYLDKR